jgi:TfoX/Sxy family transcriptional regulator of competence genes
MLLGCPSYTLEGNLFTGVFGEQVFLRLPEAGRVRAVSEGAGPFEPLKGRALKMYVLMSEAAVADGEILSEWLRRSMDFVKGLPKRPRKSLKLATKRAK